MLAIMVARTFRRKRYTTSVTSMTAIRKGQNSVSCSEARIVVLLSMAMLSFMSAGIAASNAGKLGLNAIDRLNNVGARLAVQYKQYGWATVKHSEAA